MTAGPFIRINFKTFSEFHLHIAAANENKCSAGSQQLGQRLCGWSAARTKALQVVEVHFRSVSFILLMFSFFSLSVYFFHLGFWRGNFFLIAPFSDHCHQENMSVKCIPP